MNDDIEPPIPEQRLDHMQWHADPLADATMAHILGPWPAGDAIEDAPQWQRIETINRLLSHWTDNASLTDQPSDVPGVDPAMVEALDTFVRTAQHLPDWADPARIERAERLFLEHGALSCTLLFCASLPECYVIPDLASVLHTSGQLEQHTDYRIRSTAAMVFPVMMPGGLTLPQGAGLAQALKVRLIHATIRNLILRGPPPDNAAPHDPRGTIPPLLAPPESPDSMHKAMFRRGWDTARKGLPCNQEEQAYTLLTFSYVFLRGLRQLSIGLPREDEEAYLHAWNVVGHVLGIQTALMAHTMDEAALLFERLQARGRAKPLASDPRPALAEALMRTMEQSIPWRVARNFPRLMTRHLCGPVTASDLGLIRPTPWASHLLFGALLISARAIDTLVRVFLPRFSISRSLTRVLGYHFMTQVLMDQTRPLKLPQELLDQVSDTIAGWGNDPLAPVWLNALEDRFTSAGPWCAPNNRQGI